MPPNPADARVLNSETLDPSEAKWTRLKKITYVDPLGQTRDWESAERTTRPANSKTDGVGIVAILHKPAGPELLLQKQFRPPSGAVTIEVPSGLLDPGETPSQSAVRELKEETGYVGSAVKESMVMYNDPGFCNTNTVMVHVEVDLATEENKMLEPELEDGEFIETFSLPLDGIWDSLQQLVKEGCAIDARVGTLAEGFELAKRFGKGN